MNIRNVKSLLSISCVMLFMIVGLSPLQSQDALHSPEKKSPERKAIMDALRIPVEKELKQKVSFVISCRGTEAD